MTKQSSSYVNLKDFADFTKYTMGLAAGCFVYMDKYEFGHFHTRRWGIFLSTFAIIAGIIVLSIKGRIDGDTIDYEIEKTNRKGFQFRIMSTALSVHLIFVFLTVLLAGYLSMQKIWHWHHWYWP